VVEGFICPSMSEADAGRNVLYEGFTYSVPVERVWRKGRQIWMRTTLSGHPVDAPFPWRQHPKLKKGRTVRVFLASTFWPASLAPELRDVDKGIHLIPGTNEFSAKGRVVRVVGDYAVVDCGLSIICELVPAFFIKEEQQTIRRDLKVGDIVTETGGLGFRLVDEA
jgi:hypothetical protein